MDVQKCLDVFNRYASKTYGELAGDRPQVDMVGLQTLLSQAESRHVGVRPDLERVAEAASAMFLLQTAVMGASASMGAALQAQISKPLAVLRSAGEIRTLVGEQIGQLSALLIVACNSLRLDFGTVVEEGVHKLLADLSLA